jgi:hypothetical protein
MPLHDPDPSDPEMLLGVSLPGSESSARDQAEAIAEEFARMGFERAGILELFTNPFYSAPHRVYLALGRQAIEETVDRALEVWAHCRVSVTVAAARDAEGDDDPDAGLVGSGGRLRMVRES